MKKMMNRSTTRRRFVGTAAAGAAAFNFIPSRVLGNRDQPGANEQINVAGIGVGARGGEDVKAVAQESGIKMVALCDVDHGFAAKTFQKFPDAKTFTDYRVMFDKMGDDIDAVVVGTPDHTHAVIVMEAMRRGKHVYCEKPLAHTIHEVREMMKAAHEYKIITQLGNQGHSSNHIRLTREWVKDGAIGDVHEVHCTVDALRNAYSRVQDLPKLEQEFPVPQSLNYELWLGPAMYRPYAPMWGHFAWRGWMPFGTGCIGDWMCHVLDPAFWALDLDAPTSITAEVKDYDPIKHALTYPPGSRVTYQFPARGKRKPVTVVWHDGQWSMPRPEEVKPERNVPGTGAVIRGDKGIIMHGSHGAGGAYIFPEERMEEYKAAGMAEHTIERVKGHHWDWVQAMRTGRQAGSNFDYGGPLTQVALLGAIAIRYAGTTLSWDAEAGKFTNHDEANAMLNPPYRDGWTL